MLLATACVVDGLPELHMTLRSTPWVSHMRVAFPPGVPPGMATTPGTQGAWQPARKAAGACCCGGWGMLRYNQCSDKYEEHPVRLHESRQSVLNGHHSRMNLCSADASHQTSMTTRHGVPVPDHTGSIATGRVFRVDDVEPHYS